MGNRLKRIVIKRGVERQGFIVNVNQKGSVGIESYLKKVDQERSTFSVTFVDKVLKTKHGGENPKAEEAVITQNIKPVT